MDFTNAERNWAFLDGTIELKPEKTRAFDGLIGTHGGRSPENQDDAVNNNYRLRSKKSFQLSGYIFHLWFHVANEDVCLHKFQSP